MKLKLNVAAILQDQGGRILVCERLDTKGAWQFPQGGVDKGETLEQALKREMREEISLKASAYSIAASKGPYRYVYPEGRLKKGHHGKEQFYFLLEFVGARSEIDIKTDHPEFRDTRWIFPSDFQISWLPEMKREVYREVFRDFFGICL